MPTYDPNYIPVKNYFLLGVKIILVNHRGEILVLKRSDKTSRPHGWDFPGGGLDPGENFENAAIRELYEETGLQFSNLQPLGSVHTKTSDDETVILGFSATTEASDVTLSWEHEEYQWQALNEVSSLSFPNLHTQLLNFYKNSKRS